MKFRHPIGIAAVLATLACTAARAESQYSSPDWYIVLSDYGYSDYLVYSAGAFPPPSLHEMISGEWAAAIGYDDIPLAAPEKTMWLEPDFIYPSWTSNSQFAVVEPVTPPIDLDGDGLPEGHSTIESADVRVRIEYDFHDTLTGTPIGVGGGSSVLSNRYVLIQRYVVTNLKPVALTNVRFYQFLHGHPANNETGTVDAVYDAAFYPGASAEYRYDVTQHSTSSGAVDGTPTGWTFEDHISFSSASAPDAHGLGHYRDHGLRPATGLHVAVEHDALGGEGSFGPDQVAGAARWKIASLAPGASFTFTVQLAVRSADLTPAVPSEDCVRMTATGGDPWIDMQKGACGVPAAGGPYDVIAGEVSNVIGGIAPWVLIGEATCVADDLLADRQTVTMNLQPQSAKFVLVRRGAGMQFDYGTSSAGEPRIDPGGVACP